MKMEAVMRIEKKNKKIVKCRSIVLLLPLYLLVFLLPFLPLLKEVLLIKLGESYTLTGFLKELLGVLFFLNSTIYLLMTRRNLYTNPLVILMLFFLIYEFFHIFMTTAELLNAVNNFRLLALNELICISIIFLYLNSKIIPNQTTIFSLILIPAFFVSLFGLYEKFINPDIINLYKLSYSTVEKNLGIPGLERVRIASTLGNPINLGLFLVVGIIGAIYILETTNKKMLAFINIICISLFTFVLFFSLSRTAYGSLFVILVFYLFFKLLTHNRISKKLLIILLVMLFLFPLFYFVFTIDKELILLRLFQTLDIYTISSDPRLQKWEAVMQDLYDNPVHFLWGFGLGNSGTSGLRGDFLIIENSFISILYELGIVGLIFFGSIMCYYFLNSIKLLKNKDKEKRALGLACLLYLLGFIFSSLFMDAYLNYPFSFYFWLFLALTECYRLEIKNNEIKHDIKSSKKLNQLTFRKTC